MSSLKIQTSEAGGLKFLHKHILKYRMESCIGMICSPFVILLE